MHEHFAKGRGRHEDGLLGLLQLRDQPVYAGLRVGYRLAAGRVRRSSGIGLQEVQKRGGIENGHSVILASPTAEPMKLAGRLRESPPAAPLHRPQAPDGFSERYVV